jgi:hypothetical protein
MVRDRNRRAIIAGIVTVLWLVYMIVFFPILVSVFPTVEGQGPEGTAAFIGLMAGVFVVGFIMWAASD